MSDAAVDVGRPESDLRSDSPETDLPSDSDEGRVDQLPQEPERSGARAVWREWRPSVLAGFWTWLAGIATYAMVTFVAWVPAPGEEPTLYNVIDTWHAWDTDWYTIIADFGYHIDGRSPAFFPLYPMLIHAVDPVFPDGSFAAGLFLSMVAGLTALIMMHRLTSVFLGPEVARRAAFYLLAFPTGFFLVAAYNESLLISLALGSLYLMHRGKWAGAAILAALASATKTGGALLVLPFALEYLRQHGWSPRKIRWDALWILVAPLGLVAYMAYLWRDFGNPLEFQVAQAGWFRYGTLPPWVSLELGWRVLVERWPTMAAEAVRNIIALFLVIASLVLVVVAAVGRWRLRAEMFYITAFSAVTVLLPLCSPIQLNQPPLPGFWRYVLEAPILFIMLARMGRNVTFDRTYTMIAVAVQGAMVVAFVHDQFVA